MNSATQPTGRIFVLFDDGARDIDAATVRLETERGLSPSDAVVIIHRFGGGDLPPDVVQARWVGGDAAGDSRREQDATTGAGKGANHGQA